MMPSAELARRTRKSGPRPLSADLQPSLAATCTAPKCVRSPSWSGAGGGRHLAAAVLVELVGSPGSPGSPGHWFASELAIHINLGIRQHLMGSPTQRGGSDHVRGPPRPGPLGAVPEAARNWSLGEWQQRSRRRLPRPRPRQCTFGARQTRCGHRPTPGRNHGRTAVDSPGNCWPGGWLTRSPLPRGCGLRGRDVASLVHRLLSGGRVSPADLGHGRHPCPRYFPPTPTEASRR
jgi:hypothetical protein